MKEFHAQTTIQAPSGAVWEHVTDFDSYSEWNPFMVLAFVQGEVRQGATIEIQIANQPRPVQGTIEQLVPNTRLQLKSQAPLGLLKALFTCEITPLEGNQQVKLTINETFEGLLATIFGARLEQQRPLYQAMCESLKTRVEGS